MLLLPSFHSPQVVIPSEKEKFIPNLQPFPRMAMDEEHEIEIDMLQDVKQVPCPYMASYMMASYEHAHVRF
jgi:hypothetical protein